MTALRRLAHDHRRLALWLALAALAVRLLVPAGFMAGTVEGRMALQLCSGFGPVTRAVAAPAPHHVMPAHASGHHHDRGGDSAEMPCPYAAMAQAAHMPVDPVLLAAAIAFILALGFAAPIAPAPRAEPFLRPPLRGPPLPA